jgi:3-oxoacyl-[acyl-carrier protein] reductase
VLDKLARELAGRCHVLACDLSSKEEAEALLGHAESALGHVDILINNAGLTRDNLFMRMTDDDWDQVMTVDLGAAFRLTRAAVRGMIRRRYGRIIGISSVVAVTGNPGQGNYAAAKAGLIGMTKALAHEVASRNVTVNCVAPGLIDTAMTRSLSDKQKGAVLTGIPAGRLGATAEVASAVAFLASDEAAYITGQTLHVNGGMAMI